MSHRPVRLALTDCSEGIDLWRAVAKRMNGACFTVVVNADAALGGSVAEAVGASCVVESLETALNEHGEEFDAIVVGDAASMIPKVAQLVETAQKHVILNAAAMGSLAEMEGRVEACRRAGVCFAVRRTLRFTPSVQVIKDRVAEGKLGAPGLLRVHRWRSAKQDTRRSQAETLFADVDIALWMFDATPTEVYAVARSDEPYNGAMPDYLQVHFGFPSGGMALLDFSATLPEGKGYGSLSLIGSAGAAYFDDHNNTHLLFNGGNPRALISGEGTGHLSQELQAFVDAINGDSSPPVGGKDCLAALQTVDAIRQGLEAKRALHLEGGIYV
jgi:predicted dehydrogenase